MTVSADAVSSPPVPGPSRDPDALASPAARPVPGATNDGYIRNVTAGATCSPDGALGFTAQTTLLRCATTANDPDLLWRAP